MNSTLMEYQALPGNPPLAIACENASTVETRVGNSKGLANVDTWYAIFAPANTSQTIVNKIQAAVAVAAKEKEIQDAFLTQGAVVVGGTPAELDAVIKTEVPIWKALAKEARIRVN